ncbi:MAG: radical SAM family heme chaperone HemW [Acidobacteriaceae bacterium]|nr:radical SAM family heme chaperone HemW [Acidobacteriaceae bacterium]
MLALAGKENNRQNPVGHVDPDVPLFEPSNDLSLYIHVPFCASRCGYCDFYSKVTTPDIHVRYIEALLHQLESLKPQLENTRIRTIYFGGGTPSLLGARLAPVLDYLCTNFDLEPEAEITLEANPDSLFAETLDALIPFSLNRVSLGVQSFDDELLKRLGRRHDAAQVHAALDLLHERGIPSSVDLMCALPGLADAGWAATLEEAAAAPVAHISVYPLTIEPGTDFFLQWQRGDLLETEDDIAADQLEQAQRVLEAHGFTRYEISNYARPGQEARHNTAYWTGAPYLGLGPSAASMLPTSDGGRHRFILHDTLEDYLAEPLRALDSDQLAFSEYLDVDTRRREDLMLTMRLTSGASKAAVEEAGESEVFATLMRDGLATYDETTQHYHPTQRGWLLANEVFRRIL